VSLKDNYKGPGVALPRATTRPNGEFQNPRVHCRRAGLDTLLAPRHPESDLAESGVEEVLTMPRTSHLTLDSLAQFLPARLTREVAAHPVDLP